MKWFKAQWNKFMWYWFVYRGTKCKKCADGYFYPQYGLAPHIHVGEDHVIFGSTRILPRDRWPENFVEDKDDPGCGIYYCPNKSCRNSKEKQLRERK